METSNELKQIIIEKNDKASKTSKDSGCCGPTCCGKSNDNKNNDRKEKYDGNSK